MLAIFIINERRSLTYDFPNHRERDRIILGDHVELKMFEKDVSFYRMDYG